MFTRTTTVSAKPEAVDRGIENVRDEIMPAVTEMPGCRGISMLVDRSSGRCIVATAWESEDSMHDSRQRVLSMRDKAVSMMEGSSEVEEWEVAVMHRKHDTHDGACARVARFRMDPSNADRGIDAYRMVAIPSMDELEGFCSASLMVNRETGMAVSTAAYDSREAMEHTRDQVQQLRTRVTEEAGAELVSVEEYELAMAHLHMPEMA
jgi:heme-degrading monooxygenase HmoA